MDQVRMPQSKEAAAAMNREAYNRIAPQWHLARSTFAKRERLYLEALLAAVPAGATVLDLGCGTGRPMAEYIVAQCRHVRGIDQSEAMLAFARKLLPDEQWLLASMERCDPGQGYRGALLWDSLFHLPRAEHEPILAKVVRGLVPGGRLMLTVGGSAQPAFTDFMFDREFFYDSNTPEETERILGRLGCRPILAEFMELPDGGRNKGRYAIVAEKA
jgi:SAM-dependent methyltransferase